MEKGFVAAVAAGVAVIGSHVSGFARPLEYHISPSLARTASVGLLEIGDTAKSVARSALVEKLKGSSDEQVAARAVCAALNAGLAVTDSHDVWVQRIKAYVPLEQQNDLVDKAADFLATRLVGVTEYYSLYRDACFAKY